eukprot:Nk52_evm29s367 gene=Nk52_evmTU29s367
MLDMLKWGNEVEGKSWKNSGKGLPSSTQIVVFLAEMAKEYSDYVVRANTFIPRVGIHLAATYMNWSTGPGISIDVFTRPDHSKNGSVVGCVGPFNHATRKLGRVSFDCHYSDGVIPPSDEFHMPFFSINPKAKSSVEVVTIEGTPSYPRDGTGCLFPGQRYMTGEMQKCQVMAPERSYQNQMFSCASESSHYFFDENTDKECLSHGLKVFLRFQYFGTKDGEMDVYKYPGCSKTILL